MADVAEAKAKFGGKSFSSKPYKAPASKTTGTSTTQNKSGSFGKGLAGGLLGGAIGGLLFGSLFGMGGDGMGLLPILLLGGVGYFLYRKFTRGLPKQSQAGGYGPPPGQGGGFQQGPTPGNFGAPPAAGSPMAIEEGLNQIRATDRGFDTGYFLEIASDVFFKVQAGWMSRDLESFRHLLGDQLAGEYANHFAEMEQKGVINKLESMAIRKVDICDAGSSGSEDFVTVLFTANLLDYTVNDTTGEVVEGSKTEPVKFAEKWTWARPAGTDDWKLEGIQPEEK